MPEAAEIRLSPLRCAFTGATVLAILYVACWVAAALGFSGGSHLYLSIFTLAPIASLTTLCVGVGWSIVFGAVTGALTAVTYNAFGFAENCGTANQRSLRA
jgi:hypothetical protein